MATSWSDLAERVLLTGIDATAEVQVARYTANDPTSQNRGQNDVSAPAGTPARDTLAATFSNPTTLLMLGVVAVLVVVLVTRN